MECQCKEPGFCPVFKRDMVGRLWEICSGNWVGKPLSAAKCEAYRKEWELRAGKEKKPKPSLMSCIHRGDELRTELCKTCTGRREIKVFACDIHGECSILKDVGVKICKTCHDFFATIPVEVLSKG